MFSVFPGISTGTSIVIVRSSVQFARRFLSSFEIVVIGFNLILQSSLPLMCVNGSCCTTSSMFAHAEFAHVTPVLARDNGNVYRHFALLK